MSDLIEELIVEQNRKDVSGINHSWHQSLGLLGRLGAAVGRYWFL